MKCVIGLELALFIILIYLVLIVKEKIEEPTLNSDIEYTRTDVTKIIPEGSTVYEHKMMIPLKQGARTKVKNYEGTT